MATSSTTSFQWSIKMLSYIKRSLLNLHLNTNLSVTCHLTHAGYRFGKAAVDGPSAWIPVFKVGDVHGVLKNSWFSLGPALSIVAI